MLLSPVPAEEFNDPPILRTVGKQGVRFAGSQLVQAVPAGGDRHAARVDLSGAGYVVGGVTHHPQSPALGRIEGGSVVRFGAPAGVTAKWSVRLPRIKGTVGE